MEINQDDPGAPLGGHFEATGASTIDPRAEGADGGSSIDGLEERLEGGAARKLGRYTLLDELGAGGMGAVFKAWDPALDRPVALKMMHAGRAASSQAVRRFLNEARAVARIAHRHIVEIHDMGVVDRMPFFTMSLVDGPSFEAWLAAAPTLDHRQLCGMLAPVARALGHAHRAGIVHRDIKPANLLVDGSGEVRLVDFGVARLADADMTRTGQVIGTPAYMAPEQAHGAADVDARADVYGLGAVLYRAVAGHPPPRRRDTLLTVPGASRDFEAICLMALAPDRQQRYADADALAADLERFARGEPVQAALPGPARRLGWWLRRRRVALLTIGGLVLGGLLGLQVTRWWSERRALAESRAAEATAARVLDLAEREIDALRDDGRLDVARTRFEQAAQRLDVQGTAALSRFLLDAGERALAAGHDDAPALLATAYGQASDPALRADALIGLGRYHERRGEFDRMATVLETLERTDPARFATPGARALRVRAALLGRRPDAAAALLEGDRRRLAPDLAALGRATTTALPTAPLMARARPPVAVGELLRDGRRLVQVGLDIARSEPALPPVGRLPHPPDGRWDQAPRLFADPEGRPVMLGRVQGEGGDRTALYRFAGFDAPPIRLWRAEPGAALFDAAQADLDGDGVAPIYFARPYRIRALVPAGGDRWTATDVHARMPHTWSIVNGLAASPDAARPALIASLGEWRAYDVRALIPAPDDRHLALAGRSKLGRMGGLTLDRAGRMWTVNDGLDLRPAYFPPGAAPDTPTLYRLRLDAPGGPTPDRRVPVPGGQRLDHPVAFDLLGDGRTAVSVMRHGAPAGAQITLDAAGPDPWTVPLPGFEVRAAADLDGDGDDELIAVPTDGGPVRVIGAGDAPLPPLSRLAPAAGSGDRLGDLVALGRLRAAREQYRLRVRLGRDPIESAHRAGLLGLRLNDMPGAAEDFAESARRATRSGRVTDARRGWRAAADARRRGRDTVGQRAALEALLPLLEGADRAAVAGRLETLRPPAAHTVAFDRELDPAWRLLHPDRISRDLPGARLRLLGRSDDGPLAVLPLETLGPRVTVRGDLAIDRGEASASLRIALAPGGSTAAEPLAGFQLLVGGGVEAVGLRVRAIGAHAASDVAHIPSDGIVRLPATPFRIDVDRAGGELHLTWGDAARVAVRLPPDAAPDGPLALVLSTHDHIGGRGGWIRASLGPLHLGNARTGADAPGPIQLARRELADGNPLRALTAIEDLEDAGLDQAAALDGLDRLDLADARIARLPSAQALARDRLLYGWMHQRPSEVFDRLLAMGRPILAERIFYETWSMSLRMHRDDPESRAGLAAVLPRLDVDAAAADPARAVTIVALLGRAAQLAHDAGQVRAARRGYTRLFTLAERLDELPPELRQDLVDYGIRRAELDARHGRPVDARRWLEDAVERAGAPELAVDRIRASSVLAEIWAR